MEKKKKRTTPGKSLTPLLLEYGGPPLSGTLEKYRILKKILDPRMIDADLGGHFM